MNRTAVAVTVHAPGVEPFNLTLQQLLSIAGESAPSGVSVTEKVSQSFFSTSKPRFVPLDAAFQLTTVGSHAYVHDTITGLTWTARNVSDKRLDWSAADKACKALGEGWRLPTRSELLTLVDDTTHEPCIETDLFPGAESSWYWTGTPAAWSAECAWIVNFGYGYAGYNHRYNDAFVRAVRVAAPAGQ